MRADSAVSGGGAGGLLQPGGTRAGGGLAPGHLAPPRIRPPRRGSHWGALLVLGSTVSMQAGAAVAKGLFSQVPPAGVVSLRLGLGALVLLALWRPATRLDRPTVAAVLALGTALSAATILLYEAIARLPLGVAMMLQFLGPLGVAIAQSRRRLDGLWVLLAATGIALLTAPGTSWRPDPVGVALALLAAAAWAAYILLGATVGARTTGGGGLALAVAWAALLAAPLGLVRAGAALADPRVLFGGLAVAVLSTVVANWLELEALRRIAGRTFGVMMSLEPAAAALAGLMLLGEQLDPLVWTAIACVIAASIGATRTDSEEPRPDTPPDRPTSAQVTKACSGHQSRQRPDWLAGDWLRERSVLGRGAISSDSTDAESCK